MAESVPAPRLTCFKSYDIRGRLGDNLDAGIVYRIGRAAAEVLRPGLAVTGRDVRASSPELQAALIEGLRDGGADVADIGLCGTEEVYFATDHLGAGAGLMVTASHNPIDYNGLKLVQAGARPIPPETLGAIHDLAAGAGLPPATTRGGLRDTDLRATRRDEDLRATRRDTDPRATRRDEDPRGAYVDRVLSFVDVAALRPMKILVNAGNGAAGPTFDAIADALAAAGSPLDFVRMHHDPDPGFPNGIPNPLLEENQPATAEAVRAAGADFGVAWDGDFDRCFFFDETGAFVPGEYVVALLAAAFLAKSPGATIVHDPRVQWNTQATVARAGGRAVVSRTGHALIKAKMREADAVYGGEMSAHHYFRDFMSCDSGMIPWVLVAELVSRAHRPLSALVAEMRAAYPSSGEINFRVDDAAAAMARVEAAFGDGAEIDRLDGLSLAHAEWRLNLRASNTEPVLRLNIETRGAPALLTERLGAVTALMTEKD